MHNIARELWGAPRQIEVTRRNFFGSGFLPVANNFGSTVFGGSNINAYFEPLPNPQHLDFVFVLDFAIGFNQKIHGQVPADKLNAISVDVAAPSEPRADLPQRIFAIGDVGELMCLQHLM